MDLNEVVQVANNALQDLRFAIRQLRKNPAFAATAIFVLALGLCGVIAILGFVDATLIKPLPYREQSRLVTVFQASPGNPRSMTSYGNFVDWRQRNHVFSSIDAYALNGSFTLRGPNGAEQVPGTRVSAGFFHTLGVTPLLGREFRLREELPSEARTVMISYRAWQKRFRGSRDALGRTITLNGTPVEIIGVLPPNFEFALYGGAEFWEIVRGSDTCEASRNCSNLIAIARLKDGVTLNAAASEMQSIARQLQREHPESNRDVDSATVVPLRDVIVGDIRPVLMVMGSGASLLLLIALLNVTTLLLARSDGRRREIGVRGALGASRGRLLGQFATEGLVLAGLGACVGLVFAEWGMRGLVSFVPADRMNNMPYLEGLGLNAPLIVAAGCLALAGGLLFAAIPMMRTSFSEMIEGLKEGERGSAGTTWRRFGSRLVIVEVAIAMVLMVGAGLLGKSLYVLLHVDIGFDPEHLVLVQTSWAPGSYASDGEEILLAHRMIERIQALPHVQSVALSTAPPINSAWGTTSFHAKGRANRGENQEVLHRQVSSGYFTTIGARLYRGRNFREEDDRSKPLVAIVNRALANKYFAGEDPIGKEIYYDWSPRSSMEIIGVVDDVKEGPMEGADLPALYVPYNQNPVAWPNVLVRTSGRDAALFQNIAGAIHGIDPFVTVSNGGTMKERILQSPAAYLHRSSALLAGVFAATAFLLSVIGLYGVIAYSVNGRTREIGVRMALGAERTAVYQLILREAGQLIALGITGGLACSLGAAKLLQTVLFGVRSWDVPTLSAVAATLAAAALVASYIPARRAASVNPVEALRSE